MLVGLTLETRIVHRCKRRGGGRRAILVIFLAARFYGLFLFGGRIVGSIEWVVTRIGLVVLMKLD
jgi:hypothetical protein